MSHGVRCYGVMVLRYFGVTVLRCQVSGVRSQMSGLTGTVKNFISQNVNVCESLTLKVGHSIDPDLRVAECCVLT